VAPPIPQGFDDRQHFFAIDESSAMLDLVLVDGGGKLLRFRRQLGVTVRELATLTLGRCHRLKLASPLDECTYHVVVRSI
jgi:hypothetical protein